MPPLLVKDDHGRVVQFTADTRRKRAHNNPRRHDTDKCIIACKRRRNRCGQMGKISGMSFRGCTAAHPLRQIEQCISVKNGTQTLCKCSPAVRQSKDSSSHCFASRNMCEKLAA